jgi:dolichol kinase
MMAVRIGLLSGVPSLSIHNRRETTRRLVHFGFGFAIVLLPHLQRPGGAAVAALALLYNALLAPGLGLDRAYRREGERRLSGLTSYPLAVLLLILLAPLEVAAGAWAVLAVLDPVAAAVGSRVPRPRVPFHPAKSLAGSAAGFVAGAAGCALALRYMGLEEAWGPALCAAGAAALVEALPWPIDDNLPVAAAAALALLPWIS